MSKNLYFPYQSDWTLDDWSNYCPIMEYRVVNQDDFPPFLPKSLTSKFNCGMIAASGNQSHQTFVFQGYRIDGKELDEHQYIVTYDKDRGKSYAGFVDHADYYGRTTKIPQDMIDSISLSGFCVNFRFERKPPNLSGTINDLISAGLISGFTNSVSVQNNNQK